MDKYDYVFRWLKNASKSERHIDEMESFAKKHPIIFMKFHKESGAIVKCEENDPKYIKAKEELRKIDPTGNSEVGIENGEKIGAHAHNKKSYKTYEWMQDK